MNASVLYREYNEDLILSSFVKILASETLKTSRASLLSCVLLNFYANFEIVNN